MKFTCNERKYGEWWDELVLTSPQSTVFNTVWFVKSLEKPFRLFSVENNSGEILAGVCILENSEKEMADAPYPYTPYQGILFSKFFLEMDNHKRTVYEFRITEKIIDYLCGRYSNFNMSLAPGFKDLRPFLWHNFSKDNAPKFNVTNRYTAILDLQNFCVEKYLNSIRTVRRQEYRKNIHLEVEDGDLGDFIKIYKATFERQEIRVSAGSIELISNIYNGALIGENVSLRRVCIDGETASATLFLHYAKKAYYLFGANNPKYRSSGASTMLMLSNIFEFARLGFESIDFIGVNSPNRGDYKLSFNPQLVVYYEVSLIAL
jgi:Acetyltransferase (GNAT) domain